MTNEELVAFRDSVHMPNDVPEELVPDILEILNRIPVGWGRWISVAPGWYKIVADLNRELSYLDLNYEVHQVKEKFGGLRFYFGLSPLPNFPCCEEFESKNPWPRSSWVVGDPKSEEYTEAFNKWADAHDKHYESLEHQTAFGLQQPLREDRQEIYNQMQSLADEAEELSGVTCELCSAPGKMHVRHGWIKTVCSDCALEHGYEETESE